MFIGLFTALFTLNVSAYDYKNISTDIGNGLLPVEAAKHSHDNDELSENAVQDLVDANVDVVKAVQTVAKEWSSCEDTYSSVRKAVQISPERADEIVAAIATMRGCSCNAQSFWARSRLEQRLRPRIRRALVQISDTCSCASAGIEAAIELVPNKTEDMIDAVIMAKNRAHRTADSIGQIGNIPEKKYWGDNQIVTKDTNLIRNTEVCNGDYNEQDEFSPEETWSNQGDESNLAVFNFNKKLGNHKVLCEKEKQEEKQAEYENSLIITQYIEGHGSNQALELFNSSNEPIDLLKDNYQVEVYFHGYEFPGEVIQLKGLIEPQSTFVVADANAAGDILSVTNQKVNGLIFKGADAVVLKSGFNTSPCECAVSTVASAINGMDKESNNNDVISKSKKDFIQRIEQHYENTNLQTTIIDSVGQILTNEEDGNSNQDHPIVVDKTLRRFVNTCKGDRIEMDEFSAPNQWSSFPVDNIEDSGRFATQDCFATRKDLLITEYIEGTGNNNSIELFNGTQRPIDFNTERYILEIYNDDDADPEQKIYLKGQIDSNGVFLLSNDDADDALKDKSQQVTGELKLDKARAVVLKKVVMPAYQACYADIANWIKNDINEITYILTPHRDPGDGPLPDDDPRDGDDGGELASPN